MATITIRNSQGQTQTLTPEQLQTTDPWLYSKYLTNVAQPAAGLQSTQTSTAATAQNIATGQQQLNQNQFMSNTQDLFAKSKQQNGYVDPNLYNTTQQAASKYNITSDAFDKAFGNYTDPNSINYNTASGRTNQSALGDVQRQMGAILDAYNQIPQDQRGVTGKAGIAVQNPAVGLTSDPVDYVKSLLEGSNTYLQKNAPEAASYLTTKTGLAAQLKDIVGAGSGSGVRVTQTELNNWQNLLPDPTNSDAVNQDHLVQLDNLIKAKFNTPTGLPSQYLPHTNTPAPTQGSGNPIIDLLQGAYNAVGKPVVSQLGNFANDVGVGAAMNANPSVQKSMDTGNNMANSYLQQASQTTDPVKKAALLKAASGMSSAVTPLANMVSSSFSPDVNQSNLARGLNTGSNIALLSDLGASALTPKETLQGIIDTGKGIGQKSGDILNSIGNVFKGSKTVAPALDSSILDEGANLVSEGGATRDALVQTAEKAGKTVDGTNLLTPIKQWATNAIAANPTKSDQINAMLKGAEDTFDGKVFTPTQAQGFWDEARNGYTLSSKVGNTVEAGYQRALRDGVRGELETVAPGFNEATSQIAEGITKNKVLQSVKDSMAKANLKAGLTPTVAPPSKLQQILGTGAKIALDATGIKGLSDILAGR